jgi:hypothetical protein
LGESSSAPCYSTFPECVLDKLMKTLVSPQAKIQPQDFTNKNKEFNIKNKEC